MTARARVAGALAFALLSWTSPCVADSATGADSLGPSYARFVLLTDSQSGADGSTRWLTPGSWLQGLVRTNGGFAFAGSPAYTDTVTSAATVATYYNEGSPITLGADHNGAVDVPVFGHGLVRGAPTVLLPPNMYNQQNMALMGWPGNAAPTNSDINLWCWTGVSGNSTPPNGIYISHFPTTNEPIGIYVKGDLSLCKLWADTIANQQWYLLKQGATTKTVLVSNGGHTISSWNGTNTAGSPAEYYNSSTNAMRGVMYVDGAINDLRGPDRVNGVPPAALAGNTQLLITARNDIVIQRDITLGGGNNNVLGIISANGSIHIGSSAPDDCNLDAFVMATGPTGEFAVDNYDAGAPRGVFHLRGGCTSRYFGAFGTFSSPTGTLASGYRREFVHDGRGVVPPMYPWIVMGPVLDVQPAITSVQPSRLLVGPNPARGEIACRYSLPRAGHVRIVLFDVGGRRVATLVNGARPAGDQEARWSRVVAGRTSCPPGLYFLRMEFEGPATTARVVLLD